VGFGASNMFGHGPRHCRDAGELFLLLPFSRTCVRACVRARVLWVHGKEGKEWGVTRRGGLVQMRNFSMNGCCGLRAYLSAGLHRWQGDAGLRAPPHRHQLCGRAPYVSPAQDFYLITCAEPVCFVRPLTFTCAECACCVTNAILKSTVGRPNLKF
jgi:hypothetical protein